MAEDLSDSFASDESLIGRNFEALDPYAERVNVTNEAEGPCNRVPSNLIPVECNKLTVEWAKKTFKYACFFDDVVFPCTAYEDDSDPQLRTWLRHARSMQMELRDQGVLELQEKILAILQEHHVFLPGNEHNIAAKNFDDVITIITNKAWYNKNKDANRKLIHMITYGIFRNGYNLWAIQACHDWEKYKRIVLCHALSQKAGESKKRRGKGWVYSNFVHRASNFIAEKIQKNMLLAHGEFIAVRKKYNANYAYESIRFNHFEGYIARPQSHEVMSIGVARKNVAQSLRGIFETAKRNNLPQEEIKCVCNELVDEIFYKPNSANNKGKILIKDAQCYVCY